MTVQEILHWKQELRRVRQEFLQVWQKCPRCGAKWADIAWDAESDHEFLLVECQIVTCLEPMSSSGCLTTTARAFMCRQRTAKRR